MTAINKNQANVAIDGFDPVSYFLSKKPQAGKKEFEHEWMGAAWHFSSKKNRDLFAKDPEKYAPQNGGYCTFANSLGKEVPGLPKIWKIKDNKLYLNSNRVAHTIWSVRTASRRKKVVWSGVVLVLLVFLFMGLSSDPSEPINITAENAIYKTDSNLAIGGYDTVSYFVAGEPAKGQQSFEHEWKGAKWQFSSASNRDLFMENPEKYAPQFGGYCAFAITLGDLVDGGSETWSIVDDKLYLNNNGFAKLLWGWFPDTIEKGNKIWKEASKS